MQSTSNPQRGCGTLVKGGFYARGDSAPGGMLARWAWVLGTCISGRHNVCTVVPPRKMISANLPATLGLGRLTESLSVTLSAATLKVFPGLKRIKTVALFDHVGSSNYTPWSFYSETMTLGLSRRIPPQIAKQITKYTPLPIVFTHSAMPIVDDRAIPKLGIWHREIDADNDGIDMRSFEPTFENPKWGLLAGDQHGDNHWIVPALRVIDKISLGKNRPEHAIWDTPLNEQIVFSEQTFGASWITSVGYIVDDDDTDEKLAEIEAAGIKPVVIED